MLSARGTLLRRAGNPVEQKVTKETKVLYDSEIVDAKVIDQGLAAA